MSITALLEACKPVYTIQVRVLSPTMTWCWFDLHGSRAKAYQGDIFARAEKIRKMGRRDVRVVDEHQRVLWEGSKP